MKFVRNLFGAFVISSSLILGVHGCKKEESGGRFSGDSIDGVIEKISSPKDAQDFFNEEIDYDDFRRDNPQKAERALNGAEAYSFMRVFEKRKCVCRDAACAICGPLKLRGYPSLMLSVDFVNDPEGHAVFIYKNDKSSFSPNDMKSPVFGTAGVNRSDFREPKYTLEDIAQNKIPSQFGKTLKGFAVYDLSSLDTLNGTNEGFVLYQPTVVFVSEGGAQTTGSFVPFGNGYRSERITTSSNGAVSRDEVYTTDMFLDESTCESMGAFQLKNYEKVLSRFPNSLPEEKKFEEYQNNVLREFKTEKYDYNPAGKKNSLIEDKYRPGDSYPNQYFEHEFLYDEYTYDYRSQSWREKTTRWDYNGDKIIDRITREVKNSNGTITTHTDTNADGVWDTQTTQ